MLKRLNPFRYGLIGWLWKCLLSPIAWLPALFGYTPPEDIPLREDTERWRLVLCPLFFNEHKKILKTGNAIFSAFGVDKDYVAIGLQDWSKAVSNGDLWNIEDYFSIMATEPERIDILEYLKKNPHFSISYDEMKEVQELEYRAESSAWKVKRLRQIREQAVQELGAAKTLSSDKGELTVE